MLAMVLGAGGAHARSAHEFRVEADYLARFAPFVTWPEGVFESPAAPLTICIAGADPFGPRLDALTRDSSVDGHAVQIRHVDAIDAGLHCQILYTFSERSDEALRKLAHEPVLTVTDGFPGGVIRFVSQRGRIRFTIDQAAAQDSNLTISSKLLNLALRVAR